jgi:cysteinyl-tRNA synthetase
MIMDRKLYLYNTAAREKQQFQPAGTTVGMYCCGPTVYNYAHIGNLRTYLFEDVLKRTLEAFGFTVRHVVNITDVGHLVSDADEGEDKMEKGARKEGKTVWEIARFYTDRFMENIRDLNIRQPDLWPRATDHIPEMIAMIRRLEENGFTYRTSDGIYFDTLKFPAYRDFARLEADSIKPGARVDMGDKHTPTDFALWKFSPPDVKRQMEWQSPWGVGFPGWHIECSAMSLKYLSQPLDIHCGGTDHIRVHHTNEIAQVEAATGKKFANFWIHGEFLVMDSGKMAKSAGNFLTLDTLKAEGLRPLAYRMFSFTAHYRSPLTFSWDGLKASEQSLKNLKKLISDSAEACADDAVGSTRMNEVLASFWDAVADDLNMPRAIAALWDVLHGASFSRQEKFLAAKTADTILGLDLLSPEGEGFCREVIADDGKKVTIIAQRPLSQDEIAQIAVKARDRRRARAEKQFAAADAIRAEMKSQGVELKDMPDGSTECRIG